MSVRVHNIFTYQSQNKSKMNSVKMSTFLHNEKGFLSLQSYFVIEMLSNGEKNEFSNQKLSHRFEKTSILLVILKKQNHQTI